MERLADDIVALDLQVLEERLVEQASLCRLSLYVGGLDVGQKTESDVEDCKRGVEGQLELFDQRFGCGSLAPDSRALLLEQRVADQIVVMGGQQLAFLGLQLRKAGRGAVDLTVGMGADLIDMAMHGLAYGLAVLRRQLHGGVVALNCLIDCYDAVIWLRAGVLLAPATDEIGVIISGPIAYPGVEEPTAALAAIEAAAQVVMIAPVAFAALASAVQEVLHALKRDLVDQRLMLALVDLAVVADLADVVVIAKHLGQPVDPERLRPLSPARSTTQAPCFQNRCEVAERVLAGRVKLEGQGDQTGTTGVPGNDANFVPVDDLAGVDVANWSAKRRAASLVLALHARFDLDGIAARAEGVDAGHDRVEQPSGGRVIDALKGGLQLAAVLLDLAQQPQCVEVVAGDTRKVIEDDVVRLEVGQLLKHALQRRALGAGAAFSRLGILGDYRRAELVGVALTGLALRGDRVALRISRLLDLAAARDAQIDDRALVRLLAHDVPPWLGRGIRHRNGDGDRSKLDCNWRSASRFCIASVDTR